MLEKYPEFKDRVLVLMGKDTVDFAGRTSIGMLEHQEQARFEVKVLLERAKKLPHKIYDEYQTKEQCIFSAIMSRAKKLGIDLLLNEELTGSVNPNLVEVLDSGLTNIGSAIKALNKAAIELANDLKKLKIEGTPREQYLINTAAEIISTIYRNSHSTGQLTCSLKGNVMRFSDNNDEKLREDGGEEK